MTSLLTNKEAVGTPLFILFLDRFGFEALQWESEVINEELEKLADGDVPKTNKDKVNALILALTTDRFYTDEQAFSAVCNALGGDDRAVVFPSFDPPHVDEMAWTVWEVALYDPPTKDDDLPDRFSDKVMTFIRNILEDRGHMIAPTPLDFLELKNEVPEDDEELITEIWNVQRRNSDLIVGYVKSRMETLLDQLSGLDLKDGSTEEIVSSFSEHLGEQ